MNFKKSFLKLCLIGTIFSAFTASSYAKTVNPTTNLKVFIKDEGFHEKNIVKPRIYIENNGRRVVKNVEVFYYFTIENHKNPVLENYYTPGGQVTLKKLSNRDYCVSYRFRNINLKPGEAYPNRDGFIIGIHYSDWSEMNKNNDYSNPNSPNWQLTRKVKAVDLDGNLDKREHNFKDDLDNDETDDNSARKDQSRNSGKDQSGSSININVNINKK